MGSSTSKRVQWMWNANINPSLNSDQINWRPYSDVENMIIEEAFTSGRTHAMLDDYHIDITHNLQISNYDVKQQRPIKRMIFNRNDKRLREERFIINPITLDHPDGDLYGFIPLFIKEVVKYLNLTREQLPSKHKTVIPMIVEKAALGIIEEGKKIGKQREAEEIAKWLMKKKEEEIEEVWKCSAYLYSLDSFLYKILNQTMQLIGNKDQEEVWRSKVSTLGPFCLLLWDNPFDRKMATQGKILYRGAQLSADFINAFKADCLKDPRPIHCFQSFVSCTRNSNLIEHFANANVVFIMELQVAFTVDLSKTSEYPHEEEELLFPGVSFTINKVEFDKEKNKHLIYLILQQRHSRTNQYQIQPNSMTFTQNTKTSADAVDDDVLDRAVLFLDHLLDRANLDLIHDHCYNLDGVEDDWK